MLDRNKRIVTSSPLRRSLGSVPAAVACVTFRWGGGGCMLSSPERCRDGGAVVTIDFLRAVAFDFFGACACTFSLSLGDPAASVVAAVDRALGAASTAALGGVASGNSSVVPAAELPVVPGSVYVALARVVLVAAASPMSPSGSFGLLMQIPMASGGVAMP